MITQHFEEESPQKSLQSCNFEGHRGTGRGRKLLKRFGSSGRTRTYNPSVNSRLRGLTHHGRVSLSDSKQTLTPESAKPGEASSGAKFVQKFVQLHAEMPPNFGPAFSRGGVYGQTRTRPYSPAQLSRKRKERGAREHRGGRRGAVAVAGRRLRGTGF